MTASDDLVRTLSAIVRLDERERECVARLAERPEEVEPRRTIIANGSPSSRVHILLRGWAIEAKRLGDGGRQILNVRIPGDLIGVECLAYPRAMHATASLTRCLVATLTLEEFNDIQRAHPRLAVAFFLLTLREAAILHEWEVSLGRRSALPRVAHLLLGIDRRLRVRGLAHGGPAPFPLTQQDVADATGLTTPYVNRILQELRSRDLVRLDNRTLVITDPGALAKLAGFRADYIVARIPNHPVLEGHSSSE